MEKAVCYSFTITAF